VEKVYPRGTEDVVDELEGVFEVAVIGTPDGRLGGSVTAVVVATGSSPRTTWRPAAGSG
jgi:acyl-CoA synthetase (AMP-forming)/AMP-acid ligase II